MRSIKICGKCISRRVLETDCGINCCQNESIVIYADNTILNAITEKEIVRLMRRVEIESQIYGLIIKKQNAKIVTADRAQQLELIGLLSDLEIVPNFLYFESNISKNGSCEIEEMSKYDNGPINQILTMEGHQQHKSKHFH